MLADKPTGKRPLGRPRHKNGRIILEFILKKYVPLQGFGLIRLSIRITGESS